MKMLDLGAKLYRFNRPYFEEVEHLNDADAVMFLCPVCFVRNNGPCGTHRIRIDFVGRNTPDDYCIHNLQGAPVRWNVSGLDLNDITLTPSILVHAECNWHGYVTNGGIVDA